MAKIERQQVIDLIKEKHELASKEDFLGLLDITEKTPDYEIQRSYRKLVKLVHPDNSARNDIEDFREEASFVFEALSRAYEVLTKPTKRKAYLATLENKTVSAEDVVVAQTNGNLSEEAKIAIHRGRLLLRQRNYAEAQTLLTQFVNFEPANVQGQVLLGFAIFHNTEIDLRKRLADAKTHWSTAVQIDRGDPSANYHLSLYYKAVNDLPNQKKHLKITLKEDSSHVAAKREERLLDMRLQNQDEQQESIGEFLTRLWKKLTSGKKKDESS